MTKEYFDPLTLWDKPTLLIGDVVAIAREKLRNSDCIERSYVVGDQSPI